MSTNDLEKLTAAVEFLMDQNTVAQTIAQLSDEIDDSPEPFVWSVIDLNSIERPLPETIKSGWIFVLKKGVSSGCHYHPNSVQHMATIKGQGMSKIAGKSKPLVQFGSDVAPADKWVVIDKNVPHEFFPEKENMVVVSFHTCEANELEEIGCDTGEKRLYESIVSENP
ncbi:MAG TPA: cupin domain-containing protein [Pyrinomonadaceae bacterium]|nr:cupin domain-containing protein [Pyrinomonadaceae bacterium]